MEGTTPIDEEIEKFLLQCLFRGSGDAYGLSMNRAYLDFCRTLRISDKGEAEKARRRAKDILRAEAHAVLPQAARARASTIPGTHPSAEI